MNTLNKYNLLLLFCIVVFIFGCGTENADQEIEKTSISVKLVDAPGDYDKVFVEVLDVQLKVVDDESVENSWLSLNAINKGVYNLLDLTGGVEALLVDNLKIPSGMIYEIRLVLGDNNSIVIDGQTFQLAMPSMYQKGLVIRDVKFLKPNLNYNFILDFDVDQSILKTDTPDYIILSPVIRSNLEALSGSIEGRISISDIQTKISIENSGEKISTFADKDGNFVLKGVPSGNYSIKIIPDPESGYSEQNISNIEVKTGQISYTGLIDL